MQNPNQKAKASYQDAVAAAALIGDAIGTVAEVLAEIYERHENEVLNDIKQARTDFEAELG